MWSSAAVLRRRQVLEPFVGPSEGSGVCSGVRGQGEEAGPTPITEKCLQRAGRLNAALTAERRDGGPRVHTDQHGDNMESKENIHILQTDIRESHMINMLSEQAAIHLIVRSIVRFISETATFLL